MAQDDDVERQLLDAVGAAGGGHTPDVQRALETASGWVGDAVSIVGVGELPSGEPCIVVHASVLADLPDDVDGVPVVVVIDTEPHAYDDLEA